MKASAVLSYIRDVFRVRSLRVELDRRDIELAKERSALCQLECSLNVERRHLCASEAVVESYELAERRLRAAIENVAIPALRDRAAENHEHLGQLRALDEVLQDPVDERAIRERVWAGEEWP